MRPYRIVLDTNILVAAFRSSKGASNRLLQRLDDPHLSVNLSNNVLLEYEELLKRQSEIMGLALVEIDDFLDGLCSIATYQDIAYSWRPISKDPDDDAVVELAIHAQADFLVSYNLKHVQIAEQFGISVVKPLEVLNKLEALQ